MSKPSEVDAARAVSHATRAEILRALAGAVKSPKDLAGELGESLGNVSYQVTFLRDLGAVELVDTVRRGGAVEHYYRAKIRVRVEVKPLK